MNTARNRGRTLTVNANAGRRTDVEGRLMIHVATNRRPWIIIVEPDNDTSLLVVVTAYEVSE